LVLIGSKRLENKARTLLDTGLERPTIALKQLGSGHERPAVRTLNDVGEDVQANKGNVLFAIFDFPRQARRITRTRAILVASSCERDA
jgi:hypothetical protein